jgi:hypothetical protein
VRASSGQVTRQNLVLLTGASLTRCQDPGASRRSSLTRVLIEAQIVAQHPSKKCESRFPLTG